MSMRRISVDVVRVPTKGPGDVSGLMRLIENGKMAPSSILAVLGKSEGNGKSALSFTNGVEEGPWLKETCQLHSTTLPSTLGQC